MKKLAAVLLISISSTCFAQKMKGDTLIIEYSPKIKFVKIGNDIYPMKSQANLVDASIPSIEGKWYDCKDDDWSCSITKQGNNFVLHTNEQDIVMEKKSNTLYVGAAGLVTLVYDDREIKDREKRIADNPRLYPNGKENDPIYLNMKFRWYLSGVSEKIMKFCSQKEIDSRN